MFFIPYIDIKPNFPGHDFPNNIKKTIGQLKYELNIDDIIDKMYTNQAFVDYVVSSNYSFIPLTTEYYSQEVANYFDIYGGRYTVSIDDIEYIIKIYFYKIKQTELISKEIINKFKIIFQYDYFVKNNILNMTWHSYSFDIQFIDKLNTQDFWDLSFISQYTQTKLFNHQKNNISRMLKIHQTPTVIQISDHMPIYFDNDLIYDMVTCEFITSASVPTFNITSGMIIDEPGTGKTLQFILYILETKLKTLVLVPNDGIKDGWITEYKKHIHIISDSDGDRDSDVVKHIQFDILTFMELENHLQNTEDYLNQYQIIGIDEIHNLYRNTNTNINSNSNSGYNLFEKIISSNIKYRWGITGTPFINDTSLFNIIKFLSGYKFKNERIANSPELQRQFINLFLKNCKRDMLDGYVWPKLNVYDVKVKLDIIQQHIYDAEVMLNTHSMNLRKLVCEINLMLNGDFQSPSELKEYVIMHYQKLYEKEVLKLEELKMQLQNILTHKDQFEELEYLNRVKHFESLIETQTTEVVKHRKVADYFLESIDNINKLVGQPKMEDLGDRIDDDDTNANSDFCKICWGDYTIPITYFKPCGHYFCKACIDKWKKNEISFQCPACRKPISSDDIINVQEIGDINNSPKIHELLKIIEDDNEDNHYIIFTQFDKVISTIHTILNRNNITSSTLDNYTNEKILLLSSEQNAEGINLSHFDKMIIFEPFENNVYNNQVEKQLIARIHRVGRVKPVDVYRFITEGTIEEEIYAKFS